MKLSKVLLIIMLGVFIFGCSSPEQTNNNEESINNIQKAPDFTLTSLEGEEISLSDYKGKKVLLNFWATWCQYCRTEMPVFQNLTDNYGDEVVVLAVNIMEREKEEDIKYFINSNQYTFKVLLDHNNKVSEAYNVRGLPSNYLINQDGEIEFQKLGPLTEEEIEKWLHE